MSDGLSRKCVVNLINSFPSDPNVGDIEGVLTIAYDDTFTVKKYECEYIAYDTVEPTPNIIESVTNPEDASEKFKDAFKRMDRSMKFGLEGSLLRMGYFVKLED